MIGAIPTLDPGAVSKAKRAGAVLAVVVIAAIIFAVVVFGLTKIWPRADPTPAAVARKDEKIAQHAATAIGAAAAGTNKDATVHIDLTTRDIHDAFSTLQPPHPAAPGDTRSIPAAPVDRLRNRLNEGIARANRAAGSTAASD